MGKTLADVSRQVRELIGDVAETNFDPAMVTEAINWAQDLLMRRKAFVVSDTLTDWGSAYPTGTLPDNLLVVKRVQIVTPVGLLVGQVMTYPSYLDVVIRILDESTMVMEDASNEAWKSPRATFGPRRWIPVGNKQFSVVPPMMPVLATPWVGTKVRLYYIPKATPVAVAADPIDTMIPDYYQEALRYAAVAYLMEKDTDQKSVQLKGEMMASFEYHIARGVESLGVVDTDV